MIDFDRESILRRRRAVAAIAGAVCMASVVMLEIGSAIPAIAVLGLATVVFFVHVMTYTSELETMRITDDERLYRGGRME